MFHFNPVKGIRSEARSAQAKMSAPVDTEEKSEKEEKAFKTHLKVGRAFVRRVGVEAKCNQTIWVGVSIRHVCDCKAILSLD